MELKYLNHKEFGIDVTAFSKYISKLSKFIDEAEGVLNVVFVNDPYIHSLNKAYRGQDKPTDVLSFNYMERDMGILGEVYISVQTAKRQAGGHGHSLSDELIKLIVHGILHVFGHDHELDADYKKMFAIEKKVLGRIAGELILDH